MGTVPAPPVVVAPVVAPVVSAGFVVPDIAKSSMRCKRGTKDVNESAAS